MGRGKRNDATAAPRGLAVRPVPAFRAVVLVQHAERAGRRQQPGPGAVQVAVHGVELPHRGKGALLQQPQPGRRHARARGAYPDHASARAVVEALVGAGAAAVAVPRSSDLDLAAEVGPA